MHSLKLVSWFSELSKKDVELAGGKGANLSEMVKIGLSVPNGFVVTSTAYFDFIKHNNLSSKINNLLEKVDFNNTDSLNTTSKKIKKEIIIGEISDILAKQIASYYNRLSGTLNDSFVAVRSSSNFEDLPSASFAGQQESYLNVKGDANLILKVKQVWASLFNARAIFYRHQNKLDHFRIGIAAVVQKMVNAEKSGIMFTLDPVNMDSSKIIIEAIYGLGELIVKGEINPDHYIISKDNLLIFYKNIVSQDICLKKIGSLNKKINVEKNKKNLQKISDKQIFNLSKIGVNIEKHYGFPQDIEWAIEKNKIFIVQTRPITTTIKNLTLKRESNQEYKNKDTAFKNSKQILLVTGDSASPGIAKGFVRIIKNVSEIGKILRGEIMVAPQTNPDFVPAMKKASAIVTDKGGRTSHAAIVSRELGIPAIVGAKNATKLLKNGSLVTVNGTKGEVYKGSFMPNLKTLSHDNMPFIKTATKVYVNLSDPTLADKTALLNSDGVGLLRAEFIMAQIGTHPKKLIHDGKSSIFVNKLSDSLEKFTKSFGERPVVYRTSDLKTNEYGNLIGGKQFEPYEPNPMMGFRGAFRYINDPQVFNLELEAIKKVRNIRGYKNLWIMIPFVRTIKELILVKKLISSFGLYRSENFKIWMMVELPSNVILLEKFIDVGIDGISIGSNDLTQLFLGVDRDNSEVSREFDEQNESVLWAIERVIKICNKRKVTSSICGQAASMYPSLLENMIKWGITSVSISPDAIRETRSLIAEYEKKIIS